MKEILKIMLFLLCPVLITGCGDDGIIDSKFTPINLKISGVPVNGSGCLWEVSVPKSGGSFIIEQADILEFWKDKDYGYITDVHDEWEGKYYMLECNATSWPDFVSVGPWPTDRWWKITYLNSAKLYKMRISIDENPVEEKREVSFLFDYGPCRSEVRVIQSGLQE